MLNIIGLGLRGVKSITLESLEVMKSSDRIYFETYTSVSPDSTVDDLREITGRDVTRAGRGFIETDRTIISEATNSSVSLIVTGDPLAATTHNQLRYDAMKSGVEVSVYENASVTSSIPGVTGLMHYRFGPPVSLPFVSEKFFPLSVYDKIKRNMDMNLHTLLLLDLRDGATMPVQSALDILGRLEEKRAKGALTGDRLACVIIALSQKGQKIVSGTIDRLKKEGVEGSPAAIVIPSELNESEALFLEAFSENLRA